MFPFYFYPGSLSKHKKKQMKIKQNLSNHDLNELLPKKKIRTLSFPEKFFGLIPKKKKTPKSKKKKKKKKKRKRKRKKR